MNSPGPACDVEPDEMRKALCAIAHEVKRYISGPVSENEEIPEQKVNKTKLHEKKNLDSYLEGSEAENLVHAKEGDVDLTNGLPSDENMNFDIAKKYLEIEEALQNAKEENKTLNQKYSYLVHFIKMGYIELKKMKGECPNDLPVVLQLKEIMIECGGYFADYSNERTKCSQLEQKNRYLKNKIKILENNLKGLSAEVKKLQQTKERSHISRTKKLKDQNIGYASSEKIYGKKFTVSRLSLQNQKQSGDVGSLLNGKQLTSETSSLNLSSHLSLVKNLLNDQDIMLRDLKKLSDELSIK